MAVREITVEEYRAEFRAQEVAAAEQFAVRCPVCGTVQNATSLIRAGVGRNFEDVERTLGFACVGRFTGAGPHRNGVPAGRGCDWTLGGFLKAHTLVVLKADGSRHARFEAASAAEAAELVKTQAAAPA